jgi:hypothetical protein
MASSATFARGTAIGASFAGTLVALQGCVTTLLRTVRSATVIATVLAATAYAQTPAAGPTAADVSDAPLPGDESGRIDTRAEDSFLRDVGQAVLIPPRIVLEVALAPVRAGFYVYERYQLSERFKLLFFDDSNTYGMYPTVIVDASYGLTLGARAVHRNLFGAHERLSFLGAGGGEFRELGKLTLRSGDRFGPRTHLDVGADYEQRPRDAFYGIGNAVDPIKARHRQRIMRARTTLDVQAVSHLHVRPAGVLTDIEYDRASGDVPIDELYMPSTLTGFTTGIRNVYGEVELRWDSRRLASYDSHALYERGWLLGGFAGRVHQLGDMGDDYWRYGGELQAFLPLGRGPRVLMTRLRAEAVTGAIDDVAFTQLPQVGGKAIMRGYARERFRDRLAIVSTGEYSWDLSRWLAASVFVDVGRVYGGWRELHYEDLRLGYGVSLQMHMSRRFLSGISIASSVDGGVFVDFSFDPVFDIDPRVEQQ